MSNVVSGSQAASLTLTNNTNAQSRDFLSFHYTLNGAPHTAWLPIVLPAHTYVTINATFLVPIDPPVIVFCGNKPGGTTDQPDPIVGITQPPPTQQ